MQDEEYVDTTIHQNKVIDDRSDEEELMREYDRNLEELEEEEE